MAGFRADVGEAQLFQKRSDIALMKINTEALFDHALEVSAPPAHDAVLLAIRAGVDDSRRSACCFADERGFAPPIQ